MCKRPSRRWCGGAEAGPAAFTGWNTCPPFGGRLTQAEHIEAARVRRGSALPPGGKQHPEAVLRGLLEQRNYKVPPVSDRRPCERRDPALPNRVGCRQQQFYPTRGRQKDKRPLSIHGKHNDRLRPPRVICHQIVKKCLFCAITSTGNHHLRRHIPLFTTILPVIPGLRPLLCVFAALPAISH